MSPTLIKRILSALVLAPIFLYVIIVGDTPLQIWLLFAFIISIYEWYGLAVKIQYFIPILILGICYMALSFSSFFAIRELYSINLLLMFLGMIWVSDIGAYFVGKTIGGAKLIPSISPNKTWSGFSGALIFPALFSVVWMMSTNTHNLFNSPAWYQMIFVSAILGIVIGSVGQAGDLLISFLKRKAKVKDTGTLIPGHGGLLDRIDSMLLGAPVFLALISWLHHVL